MSGSASSTIYNLSMRSFSLSKEALSGARAFTMALLHYKLTQQVIYMTQPILTVCPSIGAYFYRAEDGELIDTTQ